MKARKTYYMLEVDAHQYTQEGIGCNILMLELPEPGEIYALADKHQDMARGFYVQVVALVQNVPGLWFIQCYLRDVTGGAPEGIEQLAPEHFDGARLLNPPAPPTIEADSFSIGTPQPQETEPDGDHKNPDP